MLYHYDSIQRGAQGWATRLNVNLKVLPTVPSAPPSAYNSITKVSKTRRVKGISMRIKLDIIRRPPAGTRTVIESEVSPAFKGEGDCDYICGNCGGILAEKMRREQIKNIVVHCPKCGQYNEFL